jgi:uncharacterized protein (TIGR03435 family)
MRSDRYLIDAKPERAAGQEMMNGPMMQALLEDRFRLKIHRETREVPAYALTAPKGGTKLQPFQQGSCLLIDFTKYPTPPPHQVKRTVSTGYSLRARDRTSSSKRKGPASIAFPN